MDKVTKSYLDSFISKLGIDDSFKDELKFEHFSSFTLLSQHVNETLSKSDLESASTGLSKGVDSIAFVVNGKLILNQNELENFENQTLSIDIYFIQSKTSEGFSDSELGNFLDVVIDFFSDNPLYNLNEFEEKREIYNALLKLMPYLNHINLFCYYVSLGEKQVVATSLDLTKQIKLNQLLNYNVFTSVNIELIDKSNLLNIHKKVISPLKASIRFEQKISLPPILHVDEAYIGFLTYSEFKKLIMDDEHSRIKSLFNDNLRDFLGFENPVNLGIKDTIEKGKFNEFSLLNNGVTVIAELNSGRGQTLVLENYQIVNGCQTSNVLFECREITGIDTILIPIKVVITKNENLRDEIILTTNSQSSFTEQQLFAITQFQKTLEDFYKAHSSSDNVYYERRTNQYSQLSINRNNIIEIKEQLKSFMAMFFDLPHLVAGNIGKVVKKHKESFFQKDHKPIPYYISGLTSNKWSKLLLSDDSYKEFNKFRYHLFMGLRYLVEDLEFQQSYLTTPKSYSIKTDTTRKNSFETLLVTIRNDEKFKDTINKAITIFSKCDYNKPKSAYSTGLTEEYKKLLREHINAELDTNK